MFTTKFTEVNISVPRRVLFVHHGSLIDDGVLFLVGSNTDLEVMKVDYAGDEILANDITKTCPDVVLMGQERAGRLEILLRFLASNSALEKLRLIVFHTNDNCVDVYSKQQMHTIPSVDFLATVQSGHATF